MALLVSIGGPAWAQVEARQRVLQLNREAMTELRAGHPDDALESLTEAVALCREAGEEGPLLASTYLNMGIVECRGNQNNAAGFEHFVQAACIDPTSDIEPAHTTEDTSAVMAFARAQANAPGGCAARSPGPPSVVLSEQRPAASDVAGEVIRHTPITEQVKFVPLPVFARVNPQLEVGEVALYFRASSGAVFDRIPMDEMSGGYGISLSCGDIVVLGPVDIEYYIAVFDTQGRLVGTAGSRSAPFRVKAVDEIPGKPASLPGQQPPQKCSNQCPEWNPECETNCKGMGELCDTDAECCGTQVCDNFTCTPRGSAGGGSRFLGEEGPLIGANLSLGTGFGIVGGARAPDDATVALKSSDFETQGYGGWMHLRLGGSYFLESVPGLSVGASFRGQLTFDSPGFAPAGVLNVGYRFLGEVLDRFHLTVVGGIGGGVFYAKTETKDCKTERVDHFASPQNPHYPERLEEEDGDVGDTVTVCVDDSEDPDESSLSQNDDGTWSWDPSLGNNRTVEFQRQAGFFVIEAGLRADYWFTDTVGLTGAVLIDALVPEFVLNFDIQLGVALRF